MLITAYQVNNVLRVYGDQLRHGRVSIRPKNTDSGLPDRISISTKARITSYNVCYTKLLRLLWSLIIMI